MNYVKCWDEEEHVKRRRAEEGGRSNLEAVFNSELRSLRDVVVAFYKAFNSSIATKVEVLDFGGGLGVDRVVGGVPGWADHRHWLPIHTGHSRYCGEDRLAAPRLREDAPNKERKRGEQRLDKRIASIN